MLKREIKIIRKYKLVPLAKIFVVSSERFVKTEPALMILKLINANSFIVEKDLDVKKENAFGKKNQLKNNIAHQMKILKNTIVPLIKKEVIIRLKILLKSTM
jgi:hypothetical protein